ERLAKRNPIHKQQHDREKEEHRAVSSRQRLQREKAGRNAKVAAAVSVKVRVQRGERERDPLNGRDVNLWRSKEPRRCKREDQTADERTRHADADATSEHISAQSAQRARQECDDV